MNKKLKFSNFIFLPIVKEYSSWKNVRFVKMKDDNTHLGLVYVIYIVKKTGII